MHHGLEHAARRERRGNLVVAPHPDHFLDEVVLLDDVAPEARHDDLQREAGLVYGETQRLEDAHDVLVGRADADDALDPRVAQRDARPGLGARIHVHYAFNHWATTE